MADPTARYAYVDAPGPPDAIRWGEETLPPPAAGEVRVRHTAVGLNYIDTYHRGGLYPLPMPARLGSEAAGVVEAVGDGAAFAVGDRVATFGPSRGAYSTRRNVVAAELFALPDDVDDDTAAAVLLKGCTAEMLIERCARVEPGSHVLVWAAAGGVGHLLVGWLRAIGAHPIAVVGGPDKAAIARDAGAGHVLDHRRDDVGAHVREITEGRGAQVVLDGVGEASWDASLAAVARRGMVISYGNASGPVTGVSLGTLAARGSIFVTRPTLFDYYREPDERARGAERVFAMLRQGAIAPLIGQRMALADVAQAHRDLEAGRTRGSTVLIP